MSSMLEKIELFKKCELCHKHIATKRVSTFADKKYGYVKNATK